MANAPKSIRVVENTTVAGTRHVPAMAAIAEGYGKGDRLSLVRDAANPHDGWAVEVRDGADRRIGTSPASATSSSPGSSTAASPWRGGSRTRSRSARGRGS